MTTATRSSVTVYADSVLAGDVLTGKLVRLACERHLRDLQHGHERGLTFDEDRAERVVRFFANLHLPDGVNAGKPFLLESWEAFIVGSLFGWLRADGKRRYQYSYVEVARANGKTPLGAGIGLYCLTADQEHGAQIFSAATTRDQAKIAFRDATLMVENTAALKARITPMVNNLHYQPLNSFFRPLSADASKMDGLRVHYALVDEVHEHPNGDVLSKLRTGMKSSQPILFEITTAGFDRESVCWQEHDYTVKVLEGVVDDDTRFGFVATLDDGDGWTDETVWVKANPNLGVTVKLDTLRQECEQAKAIPAQQNSFKRLRLNLWTEMETLWLDMPTWDDQPERTPIEELAGRTCYAGIDLSTTTDFTAAVLLFPDDEGGYDVLAYFWMPEENLRDRCIRDHVQYDVWADQGFIELTPGNLVDQRHIAKRIAELREGYYIIELGFDPWNAAYLEAELGDAGAPLVKVPQSLANLSAPAKELSALLFDRKFRHGNHPVLRYMASNVVAIQDPSGNLRPHKGKSTGRIDGISAAVTALGRAMLREMGPSVYETGDLLVL